MCTHLVNFLIRDASDPDLHDSSESHVRLAIASIGKGNESPMSLDL